MQDSTPLQFRSSPGVSSALLGQASQCTELEIALGGSNRNLVELLCSDLCCASPTGHNVLLFLLHFKNSSTGEGDEQQKANPKHLKISGFLENQETGFGISLCIV